MISDLRYGARMLSKQPVFTLIAVLTLALGIGSTSAVLSLIQGVLFTSPYPQPQRLVLIPSARADGQPFAHPQAWPAKQWTEWQEQAKSFKAIAAYGWTFNFLILSDGSESLEGMWVTRDYFRVVGLQPVLGRSFLPSETGAKPAPVIILGYEFWQRKFNGDPNVIGKTIRISRQDTPPKIIGVMPPGVRFLAVLYRIAGAELQRKRAGRLLDSRFSRSGTPQRSELGRRGPFAPWCLSRAGASGTCSNCGPPSASRPRFRRGDSAGRTAHNRIESRRQSHSTALARSGCAGPIDCLRECGWAPARPWSAAAAGICATHFSRSQPKRPLPASLYRESPCRAVWRSSRRRLRVWHCQDIQADCGTRHSAARCRHYRLARVGRWARFSGVCRVSRWTSAGRGAPPVSILCSF